MFIITCTGKNLSSPSVTITRMSYRDFSVCKASRASERVARSWSASCSLTFSTASCESLAATASVRSSTWARSSRVIRSLFEWSTFHFSTLALALVNSLKKKKSNNNERDFSLQADTLSQSTQTLLCVPIVLTTKIKSLQVSSNYLLQIGYPLLRANVPTCITVNRLERAQW